MTVIRSVPTALAALLLGACANETSRSVDLAASFDCLRKERLGIAAAHRGQPDPSAAENALSSLRTSLEAGVPFLEIDVATSKDGVLLLMHDDTLDRTTTGTGAVPNLSWAEIRSVRLKRPDGTVLNEGVPTLAATLDWGRLAGARFELDLKPTTRLADVVEAVRSADMRSRVVVITYAIEDAVEVHRLDPHLMISVTIQSDRALADALRRIDARRVLGWTGTRDPRAALFGSLRRHGVEPIFGTLGRPGERLDDVYLEDGDGSEYAELVRSGAVMIASDAAVAAQQAFGQAFRRCMP